MIMVSVAVIMRHPNINHQSHSTLYSRQLLYHMLVVPVVQLCSLVRETNKLASQSKEVCPLCCAHCLHMHTVFEAIHL